MRGRLLLVRLHRYLALLAGGVVVLVALSGSALVFRKEIDERMHGGFESIEPLDRQASLQRVVGNVRAVLPGARVAQINFPDRVDGALSLVVSTPDAPWLCIYVDPYTGEILATRHPGILEFLRELHSTLMVDRVAGFAIGWYIVGACGLASLALCVTGLYLSWPGRRGVRTVLKINRHISWKRTNWDFHRVAGLVAALLLIVVSVSGTVVVFRELFRPPGDPVVVTPGLPDHGVPNPARRSTAGALSFDRLLERAEAALPGGQLVEFIVPAAPEAPVAVGKTFSGNAGGASGVGIVWLDRSTGAVVKTDGPQQASIASGILGQMMNEIHTGRIAGEPGRVLVLLTGLMPAVLFATGLPIWWLKRRVRRQQNARRIEALREARRRTRAPGDRTFPAFGAPRDRTAPGEPGGGSAAGQPSSAKSQPFRF